VVIQGWEQQDVLRLQAAEGWLDLGLHHDAMAELAELTPEQRGEPVALMLQWRAEAAAGKWEAAVNTANALMEREPDNAFGWIHRSYALHELKRTREALDLLEPALDKFTDEELVAYNLACYACQLGELDHAKELMQTALMRGNTAEIRSRALSDSDLAPLWPHIAALRP
jgi:predicted Zn-dependent protease